MTPREKADAILRDLTRFGNSLRMVREDAEAELERIREKYRPEIDHLETAIKRLDKELKTLMKKSDPDIFDGDEQVALDNGLLLRTEAEKVRIPRDALARIEARGWTEAVRVAKSVDRGVVSQWPDARLAVIGAERRAVVEYNYEIQTNSATKPGKDGDGSGSALDN
ncbi:MAG: hypothetical protein DRH56_06040 [Deltaproteobacteria bacterium]|nr:MAG: hypothetical protein DRH56_06040 [Deltaproteobacteria bacterium]